jgi:hypothetical protein
MKKIKKINKKINKKLINKNTTTPKLYSKSFLSKKQNQQLLIHLLTDTEKIN